MDDLTVVILDRPRNEALVREVRGCGARIRLIHDGDVAGALMTAWPESHIDVLMGVGGTPEGVIAAAALRCMGGSIQGKLYARTPEEETRGRQAGVDFEKVLTLDDLVGSQDVFFAATGITGGELLKGVDYGAGTAETDSLVMRGLTGTIRHITATHQLGRLDSISSIQY